MSGQANIPVRVARIEQITPLIRRFTLERVDGRELPGFSGGSHVVVTMRGDERTHHNPYSLMGSPDDKQRYQISVRRDDEGRGGSLFMHRHVAEGDTLEVSPPANLFALNPLATRHILIAGGIGITPFMAQLHELQRAGADYQLHYAFRDQENAAFRGELEAACGQRMTTYDGSAGQYVQASQLLGEQPLGTHVYVCGPKGMIEAVNEAAFDLGWANSHVHWEEFAAPPVGKPFRVVLQKSGMEITVPGASSVLEALEDAGLQPNCLCRGGVCGECETAVIEGDIEHNDHFLPEDVKQSNSRMMICVSRARSERLVLDL